MDADWIAGIALAIWGSAIAMAFYRMGRRSAARELTLSTGNLCLMLAMVKRYEEKHGRLTLDECREAAYAAIADMRRHGIEGSPDHMAMFRYAAGEQGRVVVGAAKEE